MKAYYLLPGEDACECSIGFLVELFTKLKSPEGWLGIELDPRWTMQLRPDTKKKKEIYVELLDTKLLRVRWAGMSRNESLHLLIDVVTHKNPAGYFRKITKDWKPETL